MIAEATGLSETRSDDDPRPDELPGGDAYAACWSEAERAGGRQLRTATDEERIRFTTLAAVSRRQQQELAERYGFASIADYLAHMSGEASRKGIDAADLLAMDIPALRWIVPDLLPEGTTVIASPPKIGKSCLVYQAVVETSIGGELFGRRVTPGSALYLALEDGARRGRDRLKAALNGRSMPRGRLEVRWSAPMIGQGLEDELSEWLDAHDDATIVALDTLGKVRARGDGRQNAYQVDVDDLGRLQAIFRDRRVALLIVHHARKEAGDDFLASVSGTYGLTGSADTIIAIKRKRLEAFGSINVTGRDVADSEIPVEFDGLIWRSAPAVVTEGRFERAEVYDLIRTRGPIFPKAIADELGKNRTAVQYLVGELANAKAIARTSQGYIVPSLLTDSTDSLSQVSQGGESTRATTGLLS
jgi:AAA domain